jgi:predicted Rossmann-fold nucleotide-binding protein
MLTWNQLGLLAKPVVFLDIDGFFTSLFDFFDRAVDDQFVRRSHRRLAQRALSVDEALAMVVAPVPDTPHKWIDRDAV